MSSSIRSARATHGAAKGKSAAWLKRKAKEAAAKGDHNKEGIYRLEYYFKTGGKTIPRTYTTRGGKRVTASRGKRATAYRYR